MKITQMVGLLVSISSLLGCSTYSTRDQRTAVGVAIAVVVVGAAIHAPAKHLKDDATRLDK